LNNPERTKYMLNIKNIIKFLSPVLVAGLVLTSCEDVIEVKLKNTEPQLVIEGKLYNTQFLPAMVNITESTEYFGSFEYKAVSDAKVYIKDETGEILSELTEFEELKGSYYSNFFGTEGKTYTLEVTQNGKTYTAQSQMRPMLKIDSLVADSVPIFPFQPLGQYYLHCHTTNPAGQSDYMQFILFLNNEYIRSFYLYEDTYNDGKSLDFKYFNQSLMPGDTAVVQLLSMDKATFTYLSDLSSAAVDGVGGPPTTPYNPHNNWTGGALGYFGAYAADAKFIIAPTVAK